MNLKLFVAKARVAAIHLILSALVIGFAAFLVFYLWFPQPYSTMLGGLKLFILISICDLVLGPAMTFVAFTPTKKTKLLVIDLFIIGALQLAGLGYGLFIIAQARPVFVSFTVDRFDVVPVVDIPSEQLDKAAKEYKQLSWTGPQFVWAKTPEDGKLLSQITLDALNTGVDMQHMPSLYRPYAEAKRVVLEKAKAIGALPQIKLEDLANLKQLLAEKGLAESQVKWLPVRHRNGFWIALVSAETADFVGFVPFDPYS